MAVWVVRCLCKCFLGKVHTASKIKISNKNGSKNCLAK
jgi:hypothetical protein